MNMLKLLPLELKRLLQRRFTWLVIALTAFSPVLGLVLYKPASATTMLSIYLANPAIAGGAAGGILFGVLTICEWDRAVRHRVEVLMDAVVSPLSLALVRLSALMVCALCAFALTRWPAALSKGLDGCCVRLSDYALAYLPFMGLALPLGILAAAAAYQFCRRAILRCCCLQPLRRSL